MGVERRDGVARMDPRSFEDTGRRDAFEAFTQRRLERAYRFATILLRDATEAEDAVHDAAVRAWQGWPSLRAPERLDAWFDRILVNECRQRMRRRRLSPAMLSEPLDPVGPDPVSASDERQVLRAALATLDREHRIVVILRVVEGLAIAEIAARTGDREGTVKSRLHYGLAKLRAAYDGANRLEETKR